MVNLKRIKPLQNKIVTTMNRYEATQMKNGLLDVSKQEGSIKEYQTVVAVGDFVKSVKPGDVVCINPTRYSIKKHQEGSLKDGIITDNPVIAINFPMIEIDGVEHLFLYDSDIDFIIEEFEEIEEKSNVIQVVTPKVIV